MLKLRSIDLSDYAVLEGRQRIGRIPFGHRTHALRLALERHHPSARRTPDGLGQGPRYSQGGVQGGLGSTEGPNQDELAAAYRAMNRDDD